MTWDLIIYLWYKFQNKCEETEVEFPLFGTNDKLRVGSKGGGGSYRRGNEKTRVSSPSQLIACNWR
jgi:hypothetical protein